MAAKVQAVLEFADGFEDQKDYGSFKDSLRSPIHRWFTYPAGYSHKLVESKIRHYGLTQGDVVADPFVGTGTTSIAAKVLGVNSVGIEAHPFVHWIATTKLYFDYDTTALRKDVESLTRQAVKIHEADPSIASIWPDLIYKCFGDEELSKLYAIKTVIEGLDVDAHRLDFLKTALTSTLREVTSAGAGWPYIAPSKYAERQVRRDPFEEFWKRCQLMIGDVEQVRLLAPPASQHDLINEDARRIGELVAADSVDMMLTSPPYLNNYDYADRTRMETYFWQIHDNWSDITQKVRDRLITAATTQVRRGQFVETGHCPGIRAVSPNTHSEIVDIVEQLSDLRKCKAGKKSYDFMVAGYFEDMLKVIQGVFRVLKKGRPFILVLGDSAPYGVHVRTDEIVGELAVSVGFSSFEVEIVRKRGDKWAGNSQRHKVPLRESIVTIVK